MTGPRKRRWYQFGVSALFALLTIVAVLASPNRWWYVALAIFAFGFWRAAYREDSARLGVLVLIGLYMAIVCIAMLLK